MRGPRERVWGLLREEHQEDQEDREPEEEPGEDEADEDALDGGDALLAIRSAAAGQGRPELVAPGRMGVPEAASRSRNVASGRTPLRELQDLQATRKLETQPHPPRARGTTCS